MEVRYIEIKTSPAGQIIRAYTPEQYKRKWPGGKMPPPAPAS